MRAILAFLFKSVQRATWLKILEPAIRPNITYTTDLAFRTMYITTQVSCYVMKSNSIP